MVLFVAALVFVAMVLFIYTLISAPGEVGITDEPIIATLNEEERMIIAKHQYVDGIHTVAGTAEVPTMCHRLTTEPFFTHGEMTSVEIRFNTLLEGDDCPSEAFFAPFRSTFEAPEDVVFSATWNGAPARLNIVPVAPGETLEDEMYIKG